MVVGTLKAAIIIGFPILALFDFISPLISPAIWLAVVLWSIVGAALPRRGATETRPGVPGHLGSRGDSHRSPRGRSYCSSCETVGVYHRGPCDNEGSLNRGKR
jgi:hypothetical protein